MANEYYVYEWYIIDTNEVFYVGKGKNFRYRDIKNRNKFFKDMYSSHNCKVRKVYENLTEEEAFEKEIELIKYYKTNTNFRLTNQTDGGDGVSGWKPSQEFREKQSKISRARWADEEFRDKMVQMRQDENGVYKSEEFRKKISQIVSGKNNPNYHNYWTEEQKMALSKQRKGNPKYQDENNPNAKAIICLEDGEVFPCMKYAREKYHIKEHASVTIALKEPYRTAGRRHWALFEESLLNEQTRFNLLVSNIKLNPMARDVVCLETKQFFYSCIQLAEHLNLSERTIRNKFKHNKVIEIGGYHYIKVINY